jgi:carbonic anhydrase
LSATDELLGNAERYTASFDKGDLPAPPARKLLVLTCMDARIDPLRLLGLELGDAHVLRNAGGVVTDDAIRSIALSQHLLGTDEIVLIHHTGCGLLTITDDEFSERLEKAAGERPGWRVHAFSDLDDAVRTALERVRSSPFIPHKNVRGFVYDVETGRLREVR